jgi:hypothetical protein
LSALRAAALVGLLLASGCTRGVSMNDNLAMVPAGKDNGGCRMHSLERGNQRLRAIFYETREGDYTTDRSEACH